MRSNTLFAPLLASDEVRALFSTEATLEGMLRFEMALTRALGETGTVPKAQANAALVAMESFWPDLPEIEAEALRDGLPVPVWAGQLKAHAGEAAAAVHIGATSQDLLDTSLALACQALGEMMAERLDRLQAELGRLTTAFGERPMMGRTRMQAALPIRVADRIGQWQQALAQHRGDLPAQQSRVGVVSYGGPVGLRSKPDEADHVADLIADELDLGRSSSVWHATRDNIVGYGQFLSRISGTLGKFGQDVTLMAQQGVDEVRLSGGGTSSAMPHKQNPVLAETLVALARHNGALSGGLAQAMIHEQERSGSAWTLEWLTLPQIAETTIVALDHAIRLAARIESMGHE